MLVQKIKSLPAGNPFHHDLFHMGVPLGSNVMAMVRKHTSDPCPYVILVDTRTGERLRVLFDKLPDDILPIE